MNMAVVIVFSGLTLFTAWVVFGEGAEVIEGTVLSGLFFFYHAPEWSAAGLRVFAAVAWFFLTLWFVAALADSGIRPLMMAGTGN